MCLAVCSLQFCYRFPLFIPFYSDLFMAIRPSPTRNKPYSGFVLWVQPSLVGGVLCRICVDYFAEQPNKRTYRRLVLALLVWAPLDTTMCISQGIYLAAFLNASVVLLFWYLCHRLWRSHMILSGKNHQNQPLTIRWDLVALENHDPLIPTIPALVLAKKSRKDNSHNAARCTRST